MHELEEPLTAKKKEIVWDSGAETIEVDEEGLIVLPQDYLKVRHPDGIV